MLFPLLCSCVGPAAFPTGIATNSSYSNNPNAASNHHKFSKAYADKHIKAGVDDLLSIPLKFGSPVYETKDSSGDLVWVYQARTATISNQGKFGTNYKAGFMSGSSASAYEMMTEASKRTTTLKVSFRGNGKVKSYHSTSSID